LPPRPTSQRVSITKPSIADALSTPKPHHAYGTRWLTRNAIQNDNPATARTGWAKMSAAGKTVIRVDCWRMPPWDNQTPNR
jgi:hypothetical protein